MEMMRCTCRKPLPGMLIEAAEKHNINLKKSFMIGDRWRDIDAGNSVGCTTIFIDYKYKEKLKSNPNYTVKSLEKLNISSNKKNI